MVSTVSLKELRPKLPKVIDRIDHRLDRYVVTRRGKPVIVMLGVEDYESLLETVEILADPNMMKRIRTGEREIRQGKTRSWEDVKRDLARL